jgi:hypothetical protein
MEHESFENDSIAALLNENFVSIKVDREERPDLDQIYMAAIQMMSGSGGWPMTVFLTPDLRPFTGGTYFPPEDRYGRPGFRRILMMLADAWKNRRPDITRAAVDVTQHLQAYGQIDAGEGEPKASLLGTAMNNLQKAYDPIHGGFGSAPKFPHSTDIRLLLRIAHRYEEDQALGMATHTLERMAMGGIYDHLGGGFARYSTDERWLAPHFEKMLYDNALLVVAYLEAYQITKSRLFRDTVTETLAWVEREMLDPTGAIYSTLDADSEGEEGKYYVWTQQQIDSILGEHAPAFHQSYNVRLNGNWEDPHAPGEAKNILHRTHSFADLAAHCHLHEEPLRQLLAQCRQRLFDVRSQRVRPGLDNKVLTSWNALMITAFAEAAMVLDEPRYAEVAAKAADFILSQMRSADGRLLRTWSPGSQAKLKAYHEDYAYLLEALVTLAQAQGGDAAVRWLNEATHLAQSMIDLFWDKAEGGFFYTGHDHEQLIARGKDPYDNATPAANSVATSALFRLTTINPPREDLQQAAEKTLRLYHTSMEKRPLATAQMLMALEYRLGPVKTYAIAGEEGDEMRRVLRAIHGRFDPNKIVVRGQNHPLLTNRPAVQGRVTVYLCQGNVCQEPWVGAEEVERRMTGVISE